MSGCSMMKTGDDVDAVRSSGVVSGTVDREGFESDVFVLLLEHRRGGFDTVGVVRLGALEEIWTFIAEPGVRYAVAAFHDADGDRRWSSGEELTVVGGDRAIEVIAGSRYHGFALELQDGGTPPPGSVLDAAVGLEEQRGLRFSVGEVVTLEDERFEPDVASDGMWTPAAAMGSSGAGIYFLDVYDPAKTPVLFVHGIGGGPRDLVDLVDAVEDPRLQPWLFHYPSGFRLDDVSRALAYRLTQLRDRLGFDDLVIVAHSMGGLVSRRTIRTLQTQEVDPAARGLVQTFVTLASPLGGHSAAKWGLRYAPEPVPSWIDMDPDGEFVRDLGRPLPRPLDYYLLFGYRRGGNPMMPASSDSVVQVESQLPLWAQQEARIVRGFNADHMEILSDPAALELVREILIGRDAR